MGLCGESSWKSPERPLSSERDLGVCPPKPGMREGVRRKLRGPPAVTVGRWEQLSHEQETEENTDKLASDPFCFPLMRPDRRSTVHPARQPLLCCLTSAERTGPWVWLRPPLQAAPAGLGRPADGFCPDGPVAAEPRPSSGSAEEAPAFAPSSLLRKRQASVPLFPSLAPPVLRARSAPEARQAVVSREDERDPLWQTAPRGQRPPSQRTQEPVV